MEIINTSATMGWLKERKKDEIESHIKMVIEHSQNSMDLSLRQSAKKFSIHYSILRDRLRRAKNRHDSHRAQQLFTELEEKSIIHCFERMDDRGFPLQLN